ncbi:hypothetical protein T02_12168 [Trichinella nativa]|uniref:Uncharacterized protein n=1 Tax=Trichinella nativa TaxID=6335 RepID=A0A0V1KJS3_9BILA|nr:hypothetical protein T02_12168 [Trichinella nativa]
MLVLLVSEHHVGLHFILRKLYSTSVYPKPKELDFVHCQYAIFFDIIEVWFYACNVYKMGIHQSLKYGSCHVYTER